MDMEHDGVVKISEKNVSVLLQGDDRFFNRVVSRDSSVGSSRVFYYRSGSRGVPFEWERQPGTPKHPPKDVIIPPLSPPPAVISQGLPKPCIVIEEPKPWSFGSRFMVWKQMIRKKIRSFTNKAARKNSRRSNISTTNVAAGLDRSSEVFESCTTSSDGEFVASPRNSSKSSSSYLSFSNDHSRPLPPPPTKLESPAVRESLRGPYGCSPWNFSSMLVRVTRGI